MGLISGLIAPDRHPVRKSALFDQLSRLDVDERLSKIKQNLQHHVANELGRSIDDIDTDRGIKDMVSESLALQGLANEINSDWGSLMTIDDALLLEYPTIDSLAVHLNQYYQAQSVTAVFDFAAKEIWQKSLSRVLKCVWYGQLTAAEKYLTQAADSYRDAEGRTALYVAVANQQVDMVAWLLSKGADVHANTVAGISVMNMVDVVNNPEITVKFDQTISKRLVR